MATLKDLTAFVAVLGRIQLVVAARLPVVVEGIECRVAQRFLEHAKTIDERVDIDISDCTMFIVTHMNQRHVDITKEDGKAIAVIFERSVQAISEVTIWSKAQDTVGAETAFTRQIGTVDVKVFFVADKDDILLAWLNPAFNFGRDSADIVANIFSHFIGSTQVMENGPSSRPVPPITRRVMSSLDLVNLGFYTESFVNLFSLIDDLSQETLKAGMRQKGLSPDEQEQLLRSIKERRLSLYLSTLPKLCGWQSLEDADPALYRKVLSVNTTRNRIMHGSVRLNRSESLDASDTLLELLTWLASNPFGFVIPPAPKLKLAQPHFTMFRSRVKTQGAPPTDPQPS